MLHRGLATIAEGGRGHVRWKEACTRYLLPATLGWVDWLIKSDGAAVEHKRGPSEAVALVLALSPHCPVGESGARLTVEEIQDAHSASHDARFVEGTAAAAMAVASNE